MMSLKKVLIVSTVLCFALTGSTQAEIVGLWRFDSDVDPQPDSSEYGNDAFAQGDAVSWVDGGGDRGGAMNFAGEGDQNPVGWLEVEDSDSLSIEETGITIAAWAQFEQFDTWNAIVSKTGSSAQNKPSPYDVYTHRGDGRVSFYAGEGSGAINQVNSLDSSEVEEWQHIAMTMTEDGEVLHYLNGEENGDGFIDVEFEPLVDEDMPLFIGSRMDGTTNMHGMLDDVAIFSEALTQEQIMTIMAGDFSDFGAGGGGPSVPGDFDNNGTLDEVDIDLLTAEVNKAEADRSNSFDVNNDGGVNQLDRTTWVKDLRKTWFGDSNNDGSFDSADLVQVFTRGEYEDTEAGNSNWGDGDWNGDLDFSSADLVTSFTDGGYEAGPVAAAAAVPEPASLLTLILGLCLTPLWLRRRV